MTATDSRTRNGAALEADLAVFHATLVEWVVHQQHPRTNGSGRIIGKGAPDFLACCPGHAVLFDAKSTIRATWDVALLEAHQAAHLDRWDRAGLTAGIYLRLPSGDRWVPWDVVGPMWREWWQTKARRYVTAEHGVAVVGCDWTAAIGGVP